MRQWLEKKKVKRKISLMKKKWLMVCMCGLLAISSGKVCLGAEIVTAEKGGQELLDIPDTNSEGVVVVDMATGYTIYEKNIYTSYYPASITKIMTATLTLENCQMDEVVTFSHDAVFTIEPGSCSAYADEGEQLTVEQCLYGLMLISGNDLANGLAEHIAGSMNNFAILMNTKARSLGCINTHFVNAHGLHDDEHYTCAYDMALIGKNAYKNFEMYRELIHTPRYIVPPTNKQPETRYWTNSNRMIIDYEKFYYEDCVGGKTGYTSDAGGTLVSYARINGRIIMCVTLKAHNATGAYEDNTGIFDFVKENADEAYFTKLETIYEENKESLAANEETTTAESNLSEGDNNFQAGSSSNKNEKISFGNIAIKVIILLVTIALIYYIYRRICLYHRKLERRKRRMALKQKRLEEEKKYRNEE